ncbi:MAG TPA: FtsX-like permease family protein [Bryobacteraceae bacterium]|nr:FtsX-like permease family protein [Bryobacteraceae bacterium]
MRAAGRGREIAIRSALGAGALRIARQLLVESILMALLGGGAGLLVGGWAITLLTGALPDTIQYVNLKAIRIDTTVLVFTSLVSLATGILFGLAPVFRAMREEIRDSLASAGRGFSSGHSFTRSALVVAEIALSMVLLVGAGLLIRSFGRLTSV